MHIMLTTETKNHSDKETMHFKLIHSFYAPQLVPAGTAEARISYGDSVRLSVTSRCRTKPR